MLSLVLILMTTLNGHSKAIIGGHSELSQGDSTVHIRMSPTFSCIATKIKPNILITAAHCVNETNLQTIRVSTSKLNDKIVYSTLEVENVEIHPSFASLDHDVATSYGASLEASDVALIVVKPTAEFERLKISPLDLEKVAAGDHVKYMGYGCKESFNQPGLIVPEKQSADNQVAGLEALLLDHGAYSSYYSEKSETIDRLNFITYGKRYDPSYSSLCTGDSGGGVFKNGRLVGINSNFTLNDVDKATGQSRSGISFLNLHTRLSEVKAWLNETLNQYQN